MQPGPVITTLWIAFLVLWLVAAAWSDRSAKRAGNAGQRGSRIAIAIGALLLATRDFTAPARLWPATWTDACVCLLAAGFAFSWWARLHLDRLWSARVETKAGHRVVDTGPYGIVRTRSTPAFCWPWSQPPPPRERLLASSGPWR